MPGLQNLGHTCFMNAVLQVLFSVPEFRRLLSELMDNEDVQSSLKREQFRSKTLLDRSLAGSLVSALNTGHRSTARSISVKLDQLIDLYGGQSSSSSMPSVESELPHELVEVSGRALLQQLNALFAQLEAQSSQSANRMSAGSVTPLSFYLSFLARSPGTPAFEQNDAAEFFHILMDRLDAELNALHSGIPNPISHVFQGSIRSYGRCGNCAVEFNGGETPFTELQIDVPQLCLCAEYFIHRDSGEGSWVMTSPDVVECIDHTFRQRRHGSLCPSCGADALEGQSQFCQTPSVLVLNLHPASDTGVKQGAAHRIKLTESLDLSPLSHSGGGEYSLVGVVVHNGKRATSGHYSSYAKRKGKWRFHNDSHGKTFESTQDVLDALSKQIKHAQPSLAVYERIGPGTGSHSVYNVLPLGMHTTSPS